MKKILSVFIKILKIIFIIFITIYLLFVIMHKISLKNSIFGYRVFTITDNTMADKYVINDLILVKDVKANKLKKKDIIAYYGNNDFDKKKIVFHKIIEVNKDKNLTFTTKGINSLYEDPVVNDKYVIGKVIGIIPVINIFNHVLRNPIGFSLLIFLPIILIILGEIFKVVKDIHREKEMIVLGMIEEKKKKKSILEQDDGEIEIL
mgnify:CR=1 FL=1